LVRLSLGAGGWGRQTLRIQDNVGLSDLVDTVIPRPDKVQTVSFQHALVLRDETMVSTLRRFSGVRCLEVSNITGDAAQLSQLSTLFPALARVIFLRGRSISHLFTASFKGLFQNKTTALHVSAPSGGLPDFGLITVADGVRAHTLEVELPTPQLLSWIGGVVGLHTVIVRNCRRNAPAGRWRRTVAKWPDVEELCSTCARNGVRHILLQRVPDRVWGDLGKAFVAFEFVENQPTLRIESASTDMEHSVRDMRDWRDALYHSQLLDICQSVTWVTPKQPDLPLAVVTDIMADVFEVEQASEEAEGRSVCITLRTAEIETSGDSE